MQPLTTRLSGDVSSRVLIGTQVLAELVGVSTESVAERGKSTEMRNTVAVVAVTLGPGAGRCPSPPTP